MKHLGIFLLALCSAFPSFLGAQEPSKGTSLPAAPGFVRAESPPKEGFVPPAEPVYQWSVRVGDDPYRRAYLWIPENCPRVRGIIIGIQNMLEECMFADPVIRQAATAENLGIVWITPGDDEKGPDTKFPDLLHKFDPSQEANKQVQTVLTDLANESGYAEIAHAPLIATAHSAATPFVWGMEWNFDPARMVAIFPIKGWFTGGVRPGIPVFHISSEYAEVGGKDWGETYLKDRVEMQRLRAAGPDRLVGEFVDIGAGHYEWNPDCAGVVAMFIQKAAHYRIPSAAAGNGPVALKPVDPASGWLIDPAKLGTPEGKPVPARSWTGDPAKAFWYFDEELARAVNDYTAAALAKKPQVLTVMNGGKAITDYSGGGVANLSPVLLPDGATFRVEAGFLDRSPTEKLYHGAAVGHAPGPVFFKVGSGALRQTGPDTFRICMRRGGLVPQGLPWGPDIIAYQPGDREYRRADRPVHPWLGTVNKAGAAQTITFPKIADQRAGSLGPLKLQATSSAGLPVQFYVVSGPVQIDPLDNTKLNFVKIPVRAKFPVRVVIGVYQAGHLSEPKVQNADPVFQEFMLQK